MWFVILFLFFPVKTCATRIVAGGHREQMRKHARAAAGNVPSTEIRTLRSFPPNNADEVRGHDLAVNGV